MELKKLSDKQLIDDLRELVSQEREMLSVIVQYLAELEDRDLGVKEGAPSTYAYCVKELGYSESEALSRIRAARLIREVPIAMEALEDGRLSLCAAARAQGCFQREKELDPRLKKEIVQQLFHKKLTDTDRILATHFPKTPPRERKVPINAEQTKLELTIPGATLEKMEKILCLRSHKNPSKRLDLMLDDLCDLGLWKWDPMHPRWSTAKRIPKAV